jgi:predicted SnoaL-like aldol condensation-catalyzing enzyme
MRRCLTSDSRLPDEERRIEMAATTQEVLTHHLHSFGDVAGTMADYTAESRLFTPEGLLRGPEAIREFFVRLFEEFAKPGMSRERVRQEVDGDTAYLVWKAETADNRYELGTDTFIVRGGKIVTQTFAAKISPKR